APSQVTATADLLLWYVIRKTTDGLSFKNYQAFMDFVLCQDRAAFDSLEGFERDRIQNQKQPRFQALQGRRYLPYTDTDAYRLLKIATEAFLTVNCGVPFIYPGAQNLLSGPLEGLDLDQELRHISGLGNSDLVEQWWGDYLQATNGSNDLTLPYLMLIRRTLRGDDIIMTFNIESGTWTPDEERLCYGILGEKLTMPCFVELIWSYWHEQGMLVQTMNAISRRFQNVHGFADQDPLAMIEIDPLRPLNNLLWGYVQDEQHRLSLVRRAYEYDHHYGLTLEGKAVPKLRPADSRSRFLEAFHQLLHLASIFYKQDDDTTVRADAFPVLNALKDVHMLLSEGAHNQFGDLPVTARTEMLMQQWLLARPEFRELLPTRTMVAYPEEWMDRVDAMKKLQSWINTSVLHFHHLARYGEQILLSARFGSWSEVNDPEIAKVWARFWRSQIQGYIHAYSTVTGVDLTATNVWQQQRSLVTSQPSTLLRQRLLTGSNMPSLTAGGTSITLSKPFRERKEARKAARE
ncbi:MAG: hypothetical protein KDI62_06880, partial [Anaerolineae bacterium]|nr:hypothetical protein [Anaerolineae bacterium]